MFTFDRVKYLDILNIAQLTIEFQQITAIVGASGSGKTTLLKLMNKLISPDSGEIYYHAQPLSARDSVSHRREVIMLAQAAAVYPGNVRDNLQIGRVFSEKEKSSDAELKQVLARVQLNKQLDDHTATFSGGESQRLALARVLLLNPPVMLLDEPSSALDEATAGSVIKTLVNDVKQRNKSLVMVTHDLAIARQFADVIIEIDHGEIVTERAGVQ